MILPLDRLIAYNGNRYIFTRAAVMFVDKIGNIKDYPETDENWKVVPNILNLVLNDKLHYELKQSE